MTLEDSQDRMCQLNCTSSPKQLTQLVLVVGEGTDPVGRGRRQIVALHVEVEHRDRLRKGRAPGVAHKPRGRLRLRCGDEIHEAAEVRQREREDEVVVHVVHGDLVRAVC